MHGIDFIQDLAIILIVAGAVGWLCQRIGLSVVVGYLVAGILVGPFTPAFTLVHDIARVQTLAEIGLVFLMFSIGLRLSLRKLRRLGFGLLFGVFCSAVVVYYLTRQLGAALDFGSRETLFLAAMLMVSSSAIISKVLQEAGATHDRPGQLALGVAVLEDVVAVVMLTLLTPLAQFGGAERVAVDATLGRFTAFVVLAGVAGLLLVPWLLRRLSISAGEELQTIGLAALLFGLAMLAQQAGYSLALGAFLLGTIVAETPHRAQVERTFEGMRDVFTAVFFVAIGMQLDLRVFGDSLWLILGIGLFTIVARTVAVTLGLTLIGTSARDALRVGLSVVPIGEFSFIIAQFGAQKGLVPPTFYSLAVGVSLLTTLAAPPLTRNAERISHWWLSRRPGWLRAWHTYYYAWLENVKARQKRNLLWQLSRKRFVQIGVEMLFVTGLLVFSEPLRDAVERWLGQDWLIANGPRIFFWVGLTLILIGPLIAIWRNVSALCLLFAQVSSSGHRQGTRFAPVIEAVFKFLAGFGLYVWLAPLLPLERDEKWVLLASGVVALAALLFARRKLVRWHSELEVGLQDVFQGPGLAATDTSAPWLRPHVEWNLTVSECVLPDLADCQGKRIADLALRARFGCTVVGIGRQGFMISLPAPDEVLYPRDKVLLIGTAEQVDAGKQFLSSVTGALGPTSEFEDVRMEAVEVPVGSLAVGKDLKTLSPTQSHGVQIAGIKRGELRLLNPAGDEVIRERDELLVLGTPDRIRGFRDWLTDGDGVSA